MLTSSIKKVGREFIRFYRGLLGNLKHNLPIDVEVVRCGPSIDVISHDSLLAPVPNVDIKQAFFNIGNDKALKPDGLSSSFFKKSWDILGGIFVLLFKIYLL